MKVLFIFLFLLFQFIFQIQTVSASLSFNRAAACPRFFGSLTTTPLIPEIKTITQQSMQSPLSSEFIQSLRSHSIWKKYSSFKNTENFEFTFIFPHVATLRLGEIKIGSEEESIQYHFLALVLKELFPNAGIFGNLLDIPPHKKRIKIYTEKSALEKSDILIPDDLKVERGFISLPLLKMAQSSFTPENKKSLRNSLGISSSQFVIHEIDFFSDPTLLYQWMQNFISIPQLQSKSVVFFTSSTSLVQSPSLILRLLNQSPHLFKVHYLSTLKTDSLSEPGHHFVINDRVEQIQLVHRVSDVSLVQTTFIALDGILAGTPTLVQSPGVLASTLKDKLLASGGMIELSPEYNLSQALNRVLSADIQPVFQPSSFELLNELEKILDRAFQITP